MRPTSGPTVSCAARLPPAEMGLHPDAWGNHDLLTTLPPHFRRHEPPSRAEYDPSPVQLVADKAWEAKHRRRPVECSQPSHGSRHGCPPLARDIHWRHDRVDL